MTKDFEDLVEDFKDPDILEKYGSEVALINPGDWDSLIEWAKSTGYDFDLNDLKAYFETRKEVLKKITQHPTHRAWGTTLHNQYSLPTKRLPIIFFFFLGILGILVVFQIGIL